MGMILQMDELAGWRGKQKGKVVATNGCFDILHIGHARYLKQARALGDILLVGVNSDASVRALKGEDRPINPEDDRAELLAELESVSAVVVFTEPRATRFLSLAKPDIYVKGGDYNEADLDAEETAVVKQNEGEIRILPLVPGKSTTNVIQKLRQ